MLWPTPTQAFYWKHRISKIATTLTLCRSLSRKISNKRASIRQSIISKYLNWDKATATSQWVRCLQTNLTCTATCWWAQGRWVKTENNNSCLNCRRHPSEVICSHQVHWSAVSNAKTEARVTKDLDLQDSRQVYSSRQSNFQVVDTNKQDYRPNRKTRID